jgi:hypothetical protein
MGKQLERQPTMVEELQAKHKERVEATLIGLALDPRFPDADIALRVYFDEQCRLLGLDPATFRPVGE